jgi:hypothetical protein
MKQKRNRVRLFLAVVGVASFLAIREATMQEDDSRELELEICGGCGCRVVQPCRTMAEKLNCTNHEAAHDTSPQKLHTAHRPEDEVGSHLYDLPYGVRDNYAD